MPDLHADLRVDPARSVLLVVDFQERLAAVMPPAALAACERNLVILVELARRLRIPVVTSEQYPKGLGPTVPAVAQALAAPGLDLHRLDKLAFSCTGAPGFEPIWRALARPLWLVAGMETHVCVYQSARGLVERGATVHVPADAVISRSAENRAVGLSLIEKAGGLVTSTEAVVFDALGQAGGEDFKAMQRLVK